ncbi:uncharacterized protein LOC121834450 [Ixodes scapularis]|uniref:uncharacterized protein LOC121834450 n=1 Tax=Ixodes scapularis TaxID=6945 RepID=UPI001C384D06|nr:uncharacterized protein LOC121834450 [Ixodes scapularis]
MSEVASVTPDRDSQSESTAVTSLLDAAPGVNPVVASALKQYAVLKDSMITLMKRHAKSLSHESWTDLSKSVNGIGDALTLVSMEVAHLQGKVDQLRDLREGGGPGVRATYSSVLAGPGALAGTSGPLPATVADASTHSVPVQEHRETLLVYGKPDVNTRATLTTRFSPVTLNIQDVSVRNISSNGVSVQSSNREGLDRLKSAIEGDETVKDILTPKFPVRFRPQFRVTGVDPSVTRETAFLKLKEQNGLEVTEEQLTVRSVFPDRFSGTQTFILEVDPVIYKIVKQKTFLTLGWTRCPISEFFHVVRCSKCCQYGHTRRFCQADGTVCGRCGSMHEGRCTREKKCAACTKSNEKQGTSLAVNHTFYETICPLYKQQTEKRRMRTAY